LRSEIWADDTPQRVEIGNAPTWSANTIREPQRATAWSATAIEAVVNIGNLGSLAGRYLYVIGPDNQPISFDGVPL